MSDQRPINRQVPGDSGGSDQVQPQKTWEDRRLPRYIACLSCAIVTYFISEAVWNKFMDHAVPMWPAIIVMLLSLTTILMIGDKALFYSLNKAPRFELGAASFLGFFLMLFLSVAPEALSQQNFKDGRPAHNITEDLIICRDGDINEPTTGKPCVADPEKLLLASRIEETRDGRSLKPAFKPLELGIGVHTFNLGPDESTPWLQITQPGIRYDLTASSRFVLRFSDGTSVDFDKLGIEISNRRNPVFRCENTGSNSVEVLVAIKKS